jgi:ketosteroid isomerase-like protein
MVLLYIWSEIKIQRRGKEGPMTASIDVLDLVGRWAEAEQGNDAEALDGLLAGDFVGVGPLGFVLDRQQWLARFANGLENRAFLVQDAQVRDYGDAAAVVGVLAQETSFQGRDNSGRFRLTLVAVQSPDRWRLANAHIGPLQQPPGPPPS